MIRGYMEPSLDPSSRLNVCYLVQAIDVPNYNIGMIEMQPTGRVMMIVEGEQEKVLGLLGEDWNGRVMEACK